LEYVNGVKENESGGLVAVQAVAVAAKTTMKTHDRHISSFHRKK
jgi:hypothetical protein